MSDQSTTQMQIVQTYQKRAHHYDSTVRFFDIFKRFGMDMPAWRIEAVEALHLKPGAVVVDIGCGTGLNFPILQEAIGSNGKIIGVDLTDSMLDQARRRAVENDWQNIEFVCADAAQYEFPSDLDGILSTYALTLVPDCDQVITKGCEALRFGSRVSVLDMAWPKGWSFRWRHVLFFLRAYGLTLEILNRRPWDKVWKAFDDHLSNVTRKKFWYGFMYLTAGQRPIA